MTRPFGTITGLLTQLADQLEASGLTYAFGGAVALAAWSEPRATADIDLIVWVGADELEPVLSILESVGGAVDPASARNAAATDGMFAVMVDHIRVDVFVPSIPFYGEAKERRVRTRIAGRDTWIHSAEVLAVFKLLFFRAKDLVDLERMVAVRGAELDQDYVRQSIVDMLGEDDPRVARWDAITGSC